MALDLIYGPATVTCSLCGIRLTEDGQPHREFVAALCPECFLECEEVGINPDDIVHQQLY